MKAFKNTEEPSAKFDTGKPDMSLLLMFGKAISEIAKVGTGGKSKYSRGSWQTLPDGINRYTAAMLRHVFQEHYEEIDPDLSTYTSEPIYHAAEVAWNALARLELMMRDKELEMAAIAYIDQNIFKEEAWADNFVAIQEFDKEKHKFAGE